MQKPPVNLAELLVDLVAEALDPFIQRAEPFGDHLDVGPQAFGNHVEMAASLRGAGLDFLAEVLAEFRGAGLDLLAEVLAEFGRAGLDILAEILSKPIEPRVEGVLSHG